MLNAQIEWITKLEITLIEIINLGEESDQMDRDAYSSDMILLILAYFPHKLQDELEDALEPAEEDGKMKLTLLLQFLKRLKKRRQGLLKTAKHTESARITVDVDASSSDETEGDSDDLSVDEQSEFAGCTAESSTSGSDDNEVSSDDVSDDEHPFEPGGERGRSA